MADIGKLVDVRPREAWQHEAHDFTPWLAENLDQLGEALDLVLEPEGTEIAVGAFSADLLAKDVSGKRVLVENQLEASDHGHLGQIMTYLSGLEAEIVIWVATEFRDQHVSALDWLNENTSDNFAFFGVKLRVVQIGDSKLAPIFDVVARPNEWERSLHRASKDRTGESSTYAPVRRKFWQRYLELHPEDAKLGVKVNGAPTQWLRTSETHDFNVAIYRATTGVGVFLRGVRGATEYYSLRHLYITFISIVAGLEYAAGLQDSTVCSMAYPAQLQTYAVRGNFYCLPFPYNEKELLPIFL